MISIDSPVRSLEVKLVGAVTTNQLPIVITYSERAAYKFQWIGKNLQTNNTTVVTIIAAPTINVQRELEYLSIQNKDTVNATVILQLNDDATIRQILKIILEPDDTLFYEEGKGFYTIDSSGSIKTMLLNVSSIVWGTVTGTLADQLDLQAALNLKLNSLITLNEQTDSYTLAVTDKDKMVQMNKATANNLTVPPNSSVAFSVGTQIIVEQMGAGQTTFVPGSGVTINSAGGKLKLTEQYSSGVLIKKATNTWLLAGDITT